MVAREGFLEGKLYWGGFSGMKRSLSQAQGTAVQRHSGTALCDACAEHCVQQVRAQHQLCHQVCLVQGTQWHRPSERTALVGEGAVGAAAACQSDNCTCKHSYEV